MPRFHINDKTGVPGICKAMIECPFGDLDADHYGSIVEARAAYEEKMKTTPVQPDRRPDRELSWEDDEREIVAALEGSRVVGVAQDGWGGGLLKLSNGMTLGIAPNDGCGGCASGNYDLTHLEAVDNIITSAKIVVEESPDDCEQKTYSIFVFADNTQINLATVEGNDGGGWDYGTGFRINVWR